MTALLPRQLCSLTEKGGAFLKIRSHGLPTVRLVRHHIWSLNQRLHWAPFPCPPSVSELQCSQSAMTGSTQIARKNFRSHQLHFHHVLLSAAEHVFAKLRSTLCAMCLRFTKLRCRQVVRKAHRNTVSETISPRTEAAMAPTLAEETYALFNICLLVGKNGTVEETRAAIFSIRRFSRCI